MSTEIDDDFPNGDEPEILIATLEARVKELEKDKARLDLLEKAYIHNPPFTGGTWGIVRRGRETTVFGKTLREAADEALAQEQPPPPV